MQVVIDIARPLLGVLALPRMWAALAVTLAVTLAASCVAASGFLPLD